MQLSFYKTKDVHQTIRLGEALGKTLSVGDTLFLFGELGSGKTHFIKGVAQGLNIKGRVKSPTYTFVWSHPLRGRGAFYHYDLYRLHHPCEAEGIGYFETVSKINAIHAVEWADRLQGNLPPRRIEIYFETHEDHHSIRILFLDPSIAPLDRVDTLFKQFQTPPHIQDHGRAAARVASQLAEAMMRQFKIVNVDLLLPAVLLHDILRVVDFFATGESAAGEKNSTSPFFALSQSLQKQYPKQNHAEAAFTALKKLGYTQTAETIRVHQTQTLVKHPKKFNTIEKKILYYADKRVMHDKVVSIQERYADGAKRWFKIVTPKNQRSLQAAEAATLALEKELFEGLDIRPDAIV